MVSSFLPEKSSSSPAFISVGLDMRAMSIGSGVGSKDSSSSLVISMSRSGTGLGVSSGRVEMVIGRGSSAAGDSCCGGTFGFLQVLCILFSPLQMGCLFLVDEILS